ncbi:MAG: hypothetical protein Q7S92_06650 [Candidatus Diapherotrites archaeon]|nr:hypothetical protein [Candidatus Diapherotrites archaeon]
MPKLIEREGKYFFELSVQEFSELNLSVHLNYSFSKAQEGIWVLAAEQPKENTQDLAIIHLLKQKDLKDRVEGKFEKFLNPDQTNRFQQLIVEKKIILFKLSTQYKHGIYKLPEEIEKPITQPKLESKPINFQPKEIHSASVVVIPVSTPQNPSVILLDQEGFQIIVNENAAKEFSQKNFERFKSGKIQGLKSFDGRYYVIKTELLTQVSDKILKSLKSVKKSTLADLSQQLNISPLLVKTVCQFLSEQGDIVEAKHETYQYVS